MVKSKKTQIIYRSIFLLISLVGLIGSFGTYMGVYNPNFYLYFTNLSNYFCFFSVLAMLLDDIRTVKAGISHKETEIAPLFRFSVCIMITITFLVFNIILSNPFTKGYWVDFQSLIMHLICPLMYIVDYLIFSKHRTLRLYAPACACIFPFLYVFYILVRAEIYAGTGKFAYPYFFLDIYALGFWNVMLYIFIFAICILAIGFIVWAYDKLVKTEDGKLHWDFSPLPNVESVVAQSEDMSEACNDAENKETEQKEQKTEEVNSNIQVTDLKAEEKPRKRKTQTIKVNQDDVVKENKTAKKSTTKTKSTTVKKTPTKTTKKATTTTSKMKIEE